MAARPDGGQERLIWVAHILQSQGIEALQYRLNSTDSLILCMIYFRWLLIARSCLWSLCSYSLSLNAINIWQSDFLSKIEQYAKKQIKSEDP